jgi:hypothetical protein
MSSPVPSQPPSGSWLTYRICRFTTITLEVTCHRNLETATSWRNLKFRTTNLPAMFLPRLDRSRIFKCSRSSALNFREVYPRRFAMPRRTTSWLSLVLTATRTTVESLSAAVAAHVIHKHNTLHTGGFSSPVDNKTERTDLYLFK